MTDAAETALDDIHKELPDTLRAAQGALRNVEALASKTELVMESVDRLTRSIDRLMTGTTVAAAAIKAAKGSQSVLLGVAAGVREVLRSRMIAKKGDLEK